MKDRAPDGRTARELLEDALENGLQSDPAAASITTGSPVVVGEVLDTRHPHLPGRVFVRWLDAQGEQVERWLQHERQVALRSRDRVLLTLPVGWPEWIVTGVLGRERHVEPAPDEAASRVVLEPGQVLQVVAHDGVPLLCIRQGQDGPVIELPKDHVELKAGRTLRLSADTVEIDAGQGGVDVRAGGDTVIRARTIRLN
jgi:hypothetical protein